MNNKLYNDLVNKSVEELTSPDYIYSLPDSIISELYIYKNHFDKTVEKDKIFNTINTIESAISVTAGIILSIISSPLWLLPFVVLFPTSRVLAYKILKYSNSFNLTEKEFNIFKKSKGFEKLENLATSVDKLYQYESKKSEVQTQQKENTNEVYLRNQQLSNQNMDNYQKTNNSKQLDEADKNLNSFAEDLDNQNNID